MIRVKQYVNDSVRTTNLRDAEQLNLSETNKDTRRSGLVASSQAGVHPRLEENVLRHLESPWNQPLHRPTQDLFRQLQNTGVMSSKQRLILDSGCGTGLSTRQLAGQYPRHLVIGVDRSQARLARGGVSRDMFQQDNWVLVRAELASFWRLLLDNGHFPERHFIFYPNPWPKPGHLRRRWHGHPVFPDLLSLGGEIEMRCNWEIYALEFARAVAIASGETVEVESVNPPSGISAFEKKYLERGQRLFSVAVAAETTEAFRQARLQGLPGA